jgi:hypothetical protein
LHPCGLQGPADGFAGQFPQENHRAQQSAAVNYGHPGIHAAAEAEVKKAAEPAAAPVADEPSGDVALEDMTVGDLRRKARGVEGFPLTKQEIKFAKKDELLEAFSKVN